MTPWTTTERSYDAIVCDWYGTVVTDRSSDASAPRRRIEALCAAGVDVAIVSGTHIGNVDGQLNARPAGPGRLWLCLNSGSEVFQVGPHGPVLSWRRQASRAENRALDEAARQTVDELGERGLQAAVVSSRLNRRKIDLIPLPEWSGPPQEHIDELLAAVEGRLKGCGLSSLAAAVNLARNAARHTGLVDPRIMSDAKHIEIGLTDKSDSVAWVLERLGAGGVGPGLVLVAGDEFGPLGGVPGSDSWLLSPRTTAISVGREPGGVAPGVLHLGGGPPAFLELLEEQLDRRTRRFPPWIDEDPAWTILLSSEPQRARSSEALATLASGWWGTRGAREEAPCLPGVYVSGLYRERHAPVLLEGPWWPRLDVRWQGGFDDRRLLDLRTGALVREERDGSLRTFRFSSATAPSIAMLRAEGDSSRLGPETEVRSHATRSSDICGGMALATEVVEIEKGHRRSIERITALDACTDGPARPWVASRRLERASRQGFERLLAQHRREWERRWETCAVTIDGDPASELAVRFAVFHLLSSVRGDSSGEGSVEAAAGARGLSGPGYGGHVFWDADVFTLPAIGPLRPRAARAMLQYRIRRLGTARERACRDGRAGARFPWESAGDGKEVTPTRGRTPEGEEVPILTGDLEEHITADVAWAADLYARWTGDESFLNGPGGDLIIETARYWASRAELDHDGSAHLRNVIGPDEYHERVDDNAFTNVMARWNLRRGAELVEEHGGTGTEARIWRDVADRLVDGYSAVTGRHEQFAGYDLLEPILVRDVATPPFAADAVLGRARTASSQVIKQADVLMAHHMIPDELEAGSLERDLDYYLARTSHGSSLSPSVHASVLARAGRVEEALEFFKLAARLDLDDLAGTTAEGLHLACLGGLWQAVATGFLGLRPDRRVLRLDPKLPASWSRLELRCRYRGVPIIVEAGADGFSVVAEADIPVVDNAGNRIPISLTKDVRRTPLRGRTTDATS